MATMTNMQLIRLTELSVRIKERNRRQQEKRERAQREWQRELRRCTGLRRFLRADAEGRLPRPCIGAGTAARLCRVPLRDLLRLTRGQSFRVDFGRDVDGSPLTFFERPALERFAANLYLSRGRARVEGGALPAQRRRRCSMLASN